MTEDETAKALRKWSYSDARTFACQCPLDMSWAYFEKIIFDKTGWLAAELYEMNIREYTRLEDLT